MIRLKINIIAIRKNALFKNSIHLIFRRSSCKEIHFLEIFRPNIRSTTPFMMERINILRSRKTTSPHTLFTRKCTSVNA